MLVLILVCLQSSDSSEGLDTDLSSETVIIIKTDLWFERFQNKERFLKHLEIKEFKIQRLKAVLDLMLMEENNKRK